ncbi:hypothetical protein PRUPE_3G115400 [Prunus persica]|uniref:Uncharacterized protein n=1 Tax=Prunus persica TaxID=3760 RepID=A0A251PYP0_PRUPE|nr:hypothetical protein PRUPE_3G115400 [Prunus persica]
MSSVLSCKRFLRSWNVRRLPSPCTFQLNTDIAETRISTQTTEPSRIKKNHSMRRRKTETTEQKSKESPQH